MLKTLGFTSSLLPFAFCALALGQMQQQPTPTPAQFRAQAAKLLADQAQWQKTIASVNIGDLPVPYAIGHRFEKNRELVVSDLKMAVEWAEYVAKDDSGIFDEVSFLSAVQELQYQLQQFASFLLQFDIPDPAPQKKVNSWATNMSDIANGPVNEIYTSTYLFTTRHALQLQKACSAGATRLAKGDTPAQ